MVNYIEEISKEYDGISSISWIAQNATFEYFKKNSNVDYYIFYLISKSIQKTKRILSTRH